MATFWPFFTSSFSFTRSSTKPPVTVGMSSRSLPRNTVFGRLPDPPVRHLIVREEVVASFDSDPNHFPIKTSRSGQLYRQRGNAGLPERVFQRTRLPDRP